MYIIYIIKGIHLIFISKCNFNKYFYVYESFHYINCFIIILKDYLYSLLGCRTANLNLEARSLTSWSTQRHCVVARLEHLASHSLHNIKENSGGLLLVLPQNIDSLTSEMREVNPILIKV